jgi:hypothetical protein
MGRRGDASVMDRSEAPGLAWKSPSFRLEDAE